MPFHLPVQQHGECVSALAGMLNANHCPSADFITFAGLATDVLSLTSALNNAPAWAQL
jgi:hypothetical protein